MAERGKAWGDSIPVMADFRAGVRHVGRAERALEVELDAVEDAVDETAAFLGAETFGDFDGLVDRHDGRNVGPEEHLVDGQPQDVAVHNGQASQLVVLGVADDALVRFDAGF